MHEREGDMAEEGLAREPEQDGRVLADAPEHGEVFEFVESLAQDVDALAFEFV